LNRGGPNSEGAKKYIDFLLSEYPQQVDAELGFRKPTNAHVKPPKGAPVLFSIRTVSRYLTWATDNMERTRKRWIAETGK